MDRDSCGSEEQSFYGGPIFNKTCKTVFFPGKYITTQRKSVYGCVKQNLNVHQFFGFDLPIQLV